MSLTEKALATYVHMYPTYIHNYVRMYPTYIPIHISVRCGQGHLAAVTVNGEPRQHRGTFGYVGGSGRMQNFIVLGPPVAENDGVKVEWGWGIGFIICFVCHLCLSPLPLSVAFVCHIWYLYVVRSPYSTWLFSCPTKTSVWPKSGATIREVPLRVGATICITTVTAILVRAGTTKLPPHSLST